MHWLFLSLATVQNMRRDIITLWGVHLLKIQLIPFFLKCVLGEFSLICSSSLSAALPLIILIRVNIVHITARRILLSIIFSPSSFNEQLWHFSGTPGKRNLVSQFYSNISLHLISLIPLSQHSLSVMWSVTSSPSRSYSLSFEKRTELISVP